MSSPPNPGDSGKKKPTKKKKPAPKPDNEDSSTVEASSPADQQQKNPPKSNLKGGSVVGGMGCSASLGLIPSMTGGMVPAPTESMAGDMARGMTGGMTGSNAAVTPTKDKAKKARARPSGNGSSSRNEPVERRIATTGSREGDRNLARAVLDESLNHIHNRHANRPQPRQQARYAPARTHHRQYPEDDDDDSDDDVEFLERNLQQQELDESDYAEEEGEGDIPTTTPRKPKDPKTPTHPNGRVNGRHLVMWHRPRMIEKLLLHLQYECSRSQINLPWDRAVHRLSPGSTGMAGVQHVQKLRDILVSEGHLVPPLLGKTTRHIDRTIRGYVRDMNSIIPTDTRTLRWSEAYEDRAENLEVEGVVRGSGNYKRNRNYRKGSTKNLDTLSKPASGRRKRHHAEDVKKETPTSKRKVKGGSSLSDGFSISSEDSDADFTPSKKKLKFTPKRQGNQNARETTPANSAAQASALPSTSPGGALILRLPPAVLLHFPRGTAREQALEAAVEKAMSDDIPDLDIEEGSDAEEEEDDSEEEAEEEEEEKSNNNLYMGETLSTPHRQFLATTAASSAFRRATADYENSTSFDRMFDAGAPGIPYPFSNPPPQYHQYTGGVQDPFSHNGSYSGGMGNLFSPSNNFGNSSGNAAGTGLTRPTPLPYDNTIFASDYGQLSLSGAGPQRSSMDMGYPSGFNNFGHPTSAERSSLPPTPAFDFSSGPTNVSTQRSAQNSGVGNSNFEITTDATEMVPTSPRRLAPSGSTTNMPPLFATEPIDVDKENDEPDDPDYMAGVWDQDQDDSFGGFNWST